MTTQTLIRPLAPDRTSTSGCTVTQEPGGVAVVTVRPDHCDFPDLDGLRLAISSATDVPDCRWVLFDLSAVEHVDSSALSALIGCQKLLKGRGGEAVVSGPRPNVRRMFDITRLCKVFEMADSVEDGRNRIARLHRALTQTTGL